MKKFEKLPDDELYVMLMLQRSEANGAGIDCEDTDVVLACLEDLDNCPAACKAEYEDEGDDNTVVKSGDLLIKATPSTNRKAVANGVSDLDTITLKASETITLNSVTLERYGYSDGDTVVNVWLEDENWTQITNPKSLSKDKVTLTLKKDYKELDSTDEFTIVVELAGADGDIGFKVVDVDASAKNLDLSDYDPYTYQIVTYTWATITLTQKGKNDTYNYEEGKSYEVQRFKAKAESTPITVNGFTLKDAGTVDLQDGVDDVEVTVNGEAVKGLTWEVNSKDELKINFNEVEIATRESATFAVNVTFVNGFEDLWLNVKLSLATTDFNAVEKKTWARVTVPTGLAGNTYTINGGKITLTNTKLGTVEASAETDDVIFWEGKITLGGEAIVLNPFKITFTSTASSATAINSAAAWYNANTYSPIKNVRMVIDGDEISANCVSTATVDWTNGAPDTATYLTVCHFAKTIDVDEDSNIKFLADVTKYATPTTTISIAGTTSFGKTLLLAGDTAANANVGSYDEANKPIIDSDFIGSIDLNPIKVQTPRWTLENTLTKTVEFVQGKSDTKTIFEGTYTAKNRDVYLNSFTATATPATAEFANFDELTVKVYVNGEEVATSNVTNPAGNTLSASDDFSKVLVEAGKSANIKVDVQAYPNAVTTNSIEFSFTFAWEDEDGNVAGTATETAAKFKAITKGSVTVSDSTYPKNSIILRASNPSVAKFDLKPSNSSSTVDLESLYFTVTDAAGAPVAAANLKVKVAGKEVAIDNCTSTINAVANTCKVDSDLDETLESNGAPVEIYIKWIASNALSRNYTTTLVNVNDATTNVNRTYAKMVMPVEVAFSQKDMWWSTKFTAEMDKGDNDYEITRIDFYTAEAGTCSNASYKGQHECEAATETWTAATTASWSITSISESNNGEVEIEGSNSTKMINTIVIVTTEPAGTTSDNVYTIRKDDYNDYFKVGDTYLKIFKAD